MQMSIDWINERMVSNGGHFLIKCKTNLADILCAIVVIENIKEVRSE